MVPEVISATRSTATALLELLMLPTNSCRLLLHQLQQEASGGRLHHSHVHTRYHCSTFTWQLETDHKTPAAFYSV